MAVHKLPSPIPAPYAIERGVPVPRRPGKSYPFAQMQVGDSFTVPATEVGRLRVYASRFGDYNGMQFSVQRASCRCWRIA